MKTNQSQSSFLVPQGEVEAIRQYIQLTTHIERLGKGGFSPYEKMLALKEVISMTQKWCSIGDLGLKTMLEEIETLFPSGTSELRQPTLKKDGFDESVDVLKIRIVPIYKPKTFLGHDFLATLEDLDENKKPTNFKRRCIYLSEQGNLILLKIVYEYVGCKVMAPYNAIFTPCTDKKLLWCIEQHPLFLNLCLRQIMVLAEAGIKRAQIKTESLTRVVNTLKVVSQAALERDIDALILFGVEARKENPSESAAEAHFRKVVQLAGNSTKERHEGLKQALERLRNKSFHTIYSAFGLSDEKMEKIIEEEPIMQS